MTSGVLVEHDAKYLLPTVRLFRDDGKFARIWCLSMCEAVSNFLTLAGHGARTLFAA